MSHDAAPSEPFTSQRRGKIARLPAGIRKELNLRLDDAHEADQILPWLNNLPQVRQVLDEQFGGAPISPQNLSAWRQGGFQEWLLHRQFFDTTTRLAENLEDFMSLFNCVNHDQVALKLADHMLTQLTIRFTTFMAQWGGGPPDPQTKTMLKIGQFIVKLHQAAYRGQRMAAELPAIRYRVEHEVETDLRQEIYHEMIHEKAMAIREAEAQQKENRKEKRKKNPPQTADAPPKLPVEPQPAPPRRAAETPRAASPIKPNQASPNTPEQSPSIPSIESTTQSTPTQPKNSASTAAPTPR